MRRLFGVVIFFAGCDDTIFGKTGGDDTAPSATGYAGVQEIADEHCLTCHGTTTNQLGLNLDLETDLHAATVGVIGGYGVVLVAPTLPDESMLYLKINGTHPEGTGAAMPLGSSLSAPTIQVVEDWILAGAPAQ